MGRMTVAELEVIVSARLDQLERELNEGKSQTKKFADSGEKEMRRFQKATSDAMAAIGTSIGAAFVTDKVLNFGKAAVQAAASLDSLKRGLTAVSGGSKQAEAELVRLREVAKLPGLGMKEAIQGSINLQAAGFSAKTARESLSAFGNALATVGKGKADLDGVVLALGQMASKGKISAEEINQIAERVPQIRKVMQSAFGTADTQFLQKAGLSADTFVEKVTKALKKLPPVVGGVQNDLENAADQVEQSMAEAGMAIVPLQKAFLDRAVPALKETTLWFSKLSPEAKTWIVVGAGVVAAAVPVAVAIANIAKAIESVIALKAAYSAASAARVAADNASAASAGRAAVAVGAARAAYLALAAVAAVPIVITVKAAYDLKDAADEAARAGAEASSFAFGPRDYIKMRRKQGYTGPNDALYEEFKKSPYYQPFMHSGPMGDSRDRRVAQHDAQDKARRAAEAIEKAEQAKFLAELRKAYEANAAKKKHGGKKKGGSDTIGAEDIELTETILERIAKAVKTPAGEASCAYFATEILRRTGVAIGKQGAARLVDDQILAKGGQQIRRDQAKAGDLVQFYGPGYGAWKDKAGNGYHVGVMTGPNEYMDSSGGVKRFDRTSGLKDAKFFRPKRSGDWSDAADAIGAVVDAKTIKDTEKYSELIGQLKGEIAGLQGVTESAALADAIKNKQVAAGAVVWAKEALALLKQRDALKTRLDITKKATEAMADQTKRAAMLAAKTDEERLALDLYGKTLDKVTAATRKRIEAIAEQKRVNDAAEKKKAGDDGMQALLANLEREANLREESTHWARTLAEIDELRARHGALDPAKIREAQSKAVRLDEAERKEKDTSRAQDFVEKWVQNLKEKRAKADQKAGEAAARYNDYTKELAQRLATASGPAEALKLKMAQLTEAFGGGADGAAKAQKAIEEALKVEKLEKYQKDVDRLTDRIADSFDAMFLTIAQGGKDMTANLLGNFMNMIGQMAREWAAQQVRMGAQKLITSLLPAPSSGGGGKKTLNIGGPVIGLAVGGPVLQGRAHLVGEHGPEMFVPESNGRIETNARTKGGMGGGNTFVFNIQATDAASVLKSKHQIAQEMAAAAQMAALRR